MGRVKIELRVRHAAWRSAVPELVRLTRRAAASAVAVAPPMPAERSAELAVLFVDDARMKALNQRYRGQDKPTNVLAFAAQESAPSASPARVPEPSTLLLGDVVLAYETTVREAKAAGKPVAAHVGHLVVHGVLHLLGYDHHRAREARAMEALEVRALEAIGLPDPYEAALPARAMRRRGPNRR